MDRAQAFTEMDELCDEFKAFCAQQGHVELNDVPSRLLAFGAAFTWLKLNPDEPLRPSEIN